MLRIGLDIDNTLAGFDDAYVTRFKKWPNCDWAITRNVEHILIHERDFWLGLPVLRRPDFTPKLYCSARVNSKRWTKKYLKDNDIVEGRVIKDLRSSLGEMKPNLLARWISRQPTFTDAQEEGDAFEFKESYLVLESLYFLEEYLIPIVTQRN